jgi:DNA repair exonuclease SbcCD ATPase subunit
MPPMQQASFPALPQGMAQQYQQPAPPQAPVKDDAEERRLAEEKDRLEKKITDMEKLLSAEKEKALLATLKNQQDEALSTRVESSLKDIQEKMRRDRRDNEVEGERLTLKSKIKELENRLAQERETWMGTLKDQMSERETQGRDVEGHFIYRLQEMERRWLDEKAQWQKEISSREDTIRSLKSSDEKLRDVQDEYRKISLEKSMAEREISKMRDDLARAEREKASVEAYIKMIPEKEREIADLRSENVSLRAREENYRLEGKHRDEKNVSEIGRLQAEIGTLSDRKNTEKNDAVRKEQERYEAQLQEKEKTIADISGEKVRAISELMKIKGFVSRVQAINAVLEKERGQLKLEKMQLAQNMASQMEELRRLKQESDGLKAAHQSELEAQSARASAELEKLRNELSAEFTRSHEEKVLGLARAHQEELMKVSSEKQAENSRAAADRQAEFDAKISQLRIKYEASAEEEKTAVRRQLEETYSERLQESKAATAAAMDTLARLESENRRLVGDAAVFEKTLSDRVNEFSERLARATEDLSRRDAQIAAATAQAAAAAKTTEAIDADRQRVSAENAALRENFSALAAQKSAADAETSRLAEALKAQGENLRLESENRARFESELLFLKQKIQQMELQAQESASQLETYGESQANLQAAAADQMARDNARIAELSAELDKFRAMEASLPERLKWAIKGKKQ